MEKIPSEVLVWKFGGKTGNVKAQNIWTPKSGYNLYCETNKQYLTWGKQPVGINIIWTKVGSDKRVHLHLPGKKEREILTGEPFAFGLGGGDVCLKYGNRTTGINLEWSKKPEFEWSIIGASGKKGEPILQGTDYALLNLKVEPDPDFLVYLDRIPGQADIGWTTSPNWPGKIWELKKYKEIGIAVASLI